MLQTAIPRGGRIHPARIASILLPALLSAALLAQAQTAQPAPQLTGFPFQDESLRYRVLWPSGISLGDVSFSAARAESGGWNFQASIDAGIPGFAISDQLRSSSNAALCSSEFQRDLSHAGRQTREKTTFDTHNGARRVTILPLDGGSTSFSTSACPRDPLAYFYYARQELGQGRVAQREEVYYGAAYTVQLRYTGEMSIPVAGKSTVTDHVLVTIKGPKSDLEAELFFARDAARTPLLVKLPLSMGTFSMEPVR